ncbi:MAG: phage portal protein [Alphaproteobacteria bacterium]|nr:phage portal protein [Alphaproteobacteria bacterium]
MPRWIDRLIGREMKTSTALAVLTAHSSSALTRDMPSLMRAGYEQNAIAHRCVRLIAESAASRRFIASDPVLQALIDAPGADRSGVELWEAFYGYLLLAGNAYAELQVLDEAPREILLLRPDRMRIRPPIKGRSAQYEFATSGGRRLVSRDPVSGRCRVFHMRLFHPGDDVYGFSPLGAAAAALDLHGAGADWARSLLANAARPSGALIVSGEDGRLSEEQFERLRRQMTDLHAGPGNAGRPLLLEGGLEWKPMALSPAEMDFTTARREAAREIALALGVPPLILGLPGDNTYANYKEANRAFEVQTVEPLVRKTAAALQVWLRPWFGEALSIDVEPRPVDREGAV